MERSTLAASCRAKRICKYMLWVSDTNVIKSYGVPSPSSIWRP